MEPKTPPESLEDDPRASAVRDHLGDDLSANVEPWAPLITHLSETIDYLAYYLGLQVERGKLSLKDYVWKIAIGLGAFFVGVVTLMVAIGFVLYGLALGIGEIWNQYPWLGYLVVGLTILLVVFSVIVWKLKISSKKSLRQRKKDYERTLNEQERRFGANLETRAASVGQE